MLDLDFLLYSPFSRRLQGLLQPFGVYGTVVPSLFGWKDYVLISCLRYPSSLTFGVSLKPRMLSFRQLQELQLEDFSFGLVRVTST